MRHLSGRAVTLKHSFLDDEEPLALTAVAVTVYPVLSGVDGLPVFSALAAAVDANGDWAVTLPTQPPKGEYRAEWIADAGVATDETYFEVVGSFAFTVPEARETDPELKDATKFPAVEVRHYRDVAEAEFQRITGRSATRRVGYFESSADGSREIMLPGFDAVQIISATVDDVDADVAGWRIVAGKIAQAPAALTEGAIIGIEYEYGFAPTPYDLRQAIILRTRVLLFDEGKGVPDRATSFTPAGGGTFTLAQAGARGWETGVPDVDAVYKRYDLSTFLGVYGAI